jgi:hypothetical protein
MLGSPVRHEQRLAVSPSGWLTTTTFENKIVLNASLTVFIRRGPPDISLMGIIKQVGGRREAGPPREVAMRDNVVRLR